ncbi:MAG: recombination-associated protein RdgC [Steroidobacteraceae bacterium]|jgi:recombination associated protein RdgC|nr:recombination-associated protein RdgC [Steroidobacteraceae bacterium]
MWFKNLVVYRLPADWSVSAAQLEEQLALRSLQPCGAFDMMSRGWTFPSSAQRYVHTTNGQHLIALGVEEKLLPASIIRQVAADRAKELEAQQGYPVGRRQMRELKERVTEELRGRALTRRRMTRAWIDPVNSWLVVDAAGDSRAEELVESLRDALGSLPVQLLETERSPSMSMASWLMLGDAPQKFVIDQDLELQAADKSKATIRYSRHPLEGKEIRAHLSAGMYVTKLGLTWNDRVSFVLTEKLQIKRIEFLGVADKQEMESEIDAEEQFDLDFTLMAGELARLLAQLSEVLGARAAQQAAA